MKKITIMVGPHASGKTTKANEMAKDRKSVTIYHPHIHNPFCYEQVNVDTELIIFEEITEIELVNSLINSEKITVKKYDQRPFIIDRPEIIIITQKLQEHLLKVNEYVEIIYCIHHDQFPILFDEYTEISKTDVQKLKTSCK